MLQRIGGGAGGSRRLRTTKVGLRATQTDTARTVWRIPAGAQNRKRANAARRRAS